MTASGQKERRVVRPMTEQSTAGAEDPLDRASRPGDVKQALGAVSTLVPLGLFATDSAGRCTYVNQRLIDALGLKTGGEERPVSLVLPLSESGPYGATGHSASIRVQGVAGAEGEQVLTALVIPQVGGDGTVTGYVGMVTDGDEASASAPAFLHAHTRLVDSLLDASPDIMSVFDADGSWRYSNAAAWRLLGYQSDFEPAGGVLELVHPDDAETAVDAIARVPQLANAESLTFELRIRSYDGSWRYLENVAVNLIDDSIVHGIVVRSQDVTDRREARLRLLEANQRLSTLIASFHIAALVEDEERRIALTNQAFVDLFEIPNSAHELVGRTLAELGPELSMRFGDPTRDPGPERVAKILRERRRVVGDRIVMPDGRILERDYLPIHVDRDYRGHLWLFRDVSSQAAAEAEWEQLLGRQRAENQRLVNLDHVKSAFLAEISHELRTPLTSILSFTELLRDGVGSDDPAEQREFLDVITRNADRLLRLVDDLLLLDRMERGAHPMEWNTIDVPTLVARSVTTFAPQAEAKAISLETEIGDGPPVAGDPQRIAQLLDVLLSNAVKFTPERGRVLVTAQPGEDAWRLEVADSGIGVPPGEQEALFERFYRASNARSARIPGSGLGLSVARAIAELHGGKISLGGGELGGTTVTVVLPAERHHSAADEPVP